MQRKLLHVYRNTPLGRETLLQAAWFCHKVGSRLSVYVPQQPQFLIFLPHGVETVKLDSTYLRDGASARERVRAIAAKFDQGVEFVEPSEYTAPTLPTLEGAFRWMSCPRSMSERSTKIRFGHLGPRVRSLIKAAPFPVLLTTPVYKPWDLVVCSYAGSENSTRALVRARRLSQKMEAPLKIFTQAEAGGREQYEAGLERLGILSEIESGEVEWIFADSGSLESSLFRIPREALLVIGAHGGGVVREAFFGSTLESIQTELPNNLLVVGPQVPGLDT